MHRTLLVILFGGLGFACAGAGKTAEQPDAEAAAESKPGSEDSGDADSEETTEATSDPAGGTSPIAVLLKEDAVFLLDFRKSDVGKKQEETCEQRAGDDPAKKANCMSAAMEKVKREGFLFDQDDEGQLWFVRLGIEGAKKVVYNKVKVELGEPSGSSVSVTTSGPDQAGSRRGSVPREFTITVPDEYTATIDDPAKGKMVYELRLGLFEDQSQ